MEYFVRTIDYVGGKVVIIDQTALPESEIYLEISDPGELADAIRVLKIRGAPALGIAAAYGVLLELERVILASQPETAEYIFDHGSFPADFDASGLDAGKVAESLLETADMLAATRPTAVNLVNGLNLVREAVERARGDVSAMAEQVSAAAFALHDRERDTDLRIGELGAALLRDGMTVLTHCNAGGLATSGYGTALAAIKRAHERGKRISVYVDETRPLLQGARLTAWELVRAGIEATVLCDSAAASLLSSGKIDAVITGADRIALNGDSANKIGTLGLAVMCEKYGIPMYIAAPWSTFDLGIDSAGDIVIEHRGEEEVKSFSGLVTAPEGAGAYNPAFDITPAQMLTAIITDTCVIESPEREKIVRAAAAAGHLPAE